MWRKFKSKWKEYLASDCDRLEFLCEPLEDRLLLAVDVIDVNPGNGSSSPLVPTVIGTDLYFTAQDTVHGRELRVLDTTTGSASTIVTGPTSSFPWQLTAVGTKLAFVNTNQGLSILDPADNSITTFGSIGSPFDLHVVGTKLIFKGTDPAIGIEVHILDTIDDSITTIDVVPGASGSFPSSFTSTGTDVYFTTGLNPTGATLWELDTTDNSTTLIKSGLDFSTDFAANSVPLRARIGSKLYFSAQSELWQYETSTGATIKVAGAPAVSDKAAFTAVGSQLYFAGTDATTGTELRALDTNDNSITTFDLQSGANSGFFYDTTIHNNGSFLYFAARLNSVHVLDTTTNTVDTVGFTSPGRLDAASPYYLSDGTDVYITHAVEPSVGVEIAVLDGTNSSIQFADIVAGSFGSLGGVRTGLILIGDTMYFSGWTPEAGNEMFAWSLNREVPSIVDLDGGVTFSEGAPGVVIDSDVTISDAELDAANNGSGNFGRSSLTVSREAGAASDDLFGFDTTAASFIVSGGDLQSDGQTFGTFAVSGGTLTIEFTSLETSATSLLVNEVARSITYANDSAAPPTNVTLRFSFDDGEPIPLDDSKTAVVKINRRPVWIDLDGGNPYAQNDSAILVDDDVTISDQEFEALGNYGMASLTVSREGGADADDVISLDATGDISVTGNQVAIATTDVGTLTSTGSTLSLVFNSSATTASVNQILQAVTYEYNGGKHTSGVSLEYTFADEVTPYPGTAVGIATVNVAPLAEDDTTTTGENSSLQIDVLDNDEDPEGDPLTIISAEVSNGFGTVQIVNNQLVYDPGLNYDFLAVNEPDSVEISYEVEDSLGLTDSAIVDISIVGVNDEPLIASIVGPTSNVRIGESIVYSAVADDPDSNDTLSTSWQITDDEGSTVASSTDDTIEFTPNQFGEFTVTATVVDEHGGTHTQSTVLSVTPSFLDGSMLVIQGTEANDRIKIVGRKSEYLVSVGKIKETYSLDDISSIKVYGLDGNDNITFNSKVTVATEVHAGDGDDKVTGGSGIDVVYGGNGNDRINGKNGNDELYGEQGDDNLNGGKDDDLLDGGAGNDRLIGSSGNDHLIGGLNDDFLSGGGGDDLMDGGPGADIFRGGPGNNTIIDDD